MTKLVNEINNQVKCYLAISRTGECRPTRQTVIKRYIVQLDEGATGTQTYVNLL